MPRYLHLRKDLQPEPDTLNTITNPDAKDIAFPVHRDTHDNIERGGTDLTVTDLHHDHVNEDHQVDSGRLDHSASSPTIFSMIQLMVSFNTLAPYTSSKWATTPPMLNPQALQRQHNLTDAAQTSLPFRDNDRPERANTITENHRSQPAQSRSTPS